MALRGPARRPSPVGSAGTVAWALRHTVHRPRGLDLLAWTDGIAFLQELGERRPRALGDRVLQLPGQIGEGNVGMDRLNVAQQLVGQPARAALQRGDAVEDRRENDRLHDVVRGSWHFGSPVGPIASSLAWTQAAAVD